MPVRLISSIVLAVLFLVPALSQEQRENPIVKGEVSGTNDDVRIDDAGLTLLGDLAEAGSGLEVNDYQTIRLSIEEVTDDLKEIGVTTERVQTRVELRLRSLNLIPSLDSFSRNGVLSVRVGGVGSAFNVSLKYSRPGSYFVCCQAPFTAYRRLVSVWDTGRLGTHAGNLNFVLKALELALDEFLNDYLAANQP